MIEIGNTKLQMEYYRKGNQILLCHKGIQNTAFTFTAFFLQSPLKGAD